MSKLDDFFGGGGSYAADIEALSTAITQINSQLVGMEFYFPANVTGISSSFVPKTGGEYSRATYPNLWTQLEDHPEIVVSEATWQAHKTMSPTGAVSVYSSGDGSTTFRVPTVGDGGFTRAVGEAGQTPLGNAEEGFASQVEDHAHLQPTPATSGGSIYNADVTNAIYGTENETFPVNSAWFLSGGSFFSGGSVTAAKTSPSTYDNSGETSPQGHYATVYIYTGNIISSLASPEPDWLAQQAVNTNNITDLQNASARTRDQLFLGTAGASSVIDVTGWKNNYDELEVRSIATNSSGGLIWNTARIPNDFFNGGTFVVNNVALVSGGTTFFGHVTVVVQEDTLTVGAVSGGWATPGYVAEVNGIKYGE